MEVSVGSFHGQIQKDSRLQLRATCYGGSYLHEGAFAAETTGDVAAIYTSRASLFNYPGKDREDDTVWVPTAKRTPPVGTQVTVTITPVAPSSN